MTKKEIKAAQFKTLMSQVNALYALDRKVYVDTLEGKTLATVIEINASKFTVSCSVVLDLGNGRQQTLMFTAADIVKEEAAPVDAYQDLDTEQTEGEPTSEEINNVFESEGFCSFMDAVEANTKKIAKIVKKDSWQLTHDQKHYYYHQKQMQELQIQYESKLLDQYHEGYKKGQAELNHIVNP